MHAIGRTLRGAALAFTGAVTITVISSTQLPAIGAIGSALFGGGIAAAEPARLIKRQRRRQQQIRVVGQNEYKAMRIVREPNQPD